ncbi:MAG TPA: prepilin-type N-terminal cleavage/methylation domain-containing protein [Chthoniobacterales bacterium]|jgi:prepilin-type N-terminal cleavage/methylation domain-containing protein|nr:prepilin-type N-terminal cleavage/methylation domain-containing protein [Chthoniobacterales bacterium]
MRISSRNAGFTLVELMVTVALIAVVGLVLYSILYTTTILGAKNTAVNAAHQQARVALIEMLQDIHSSVSLPVLSDSSGTPYASPAPTAAAGISFQQWSSGPHMIKNDVAVGATQIQIVFTAGSGPTPIAGQRVIIPAVQIEADITSVDNSSPANPKLTLGNISGPAQTPPVTYPTSTIPVAIKGTGSSAGDVVCFITDRCSYAVGGNILTWRWKGNSKMIADYITNPTPFSTPVTPAGALYYRFVAGINLSTSDDQYSNRGFKSANILLNGQVPYKSRLTTYQ